jgi:hypothetical protein
MYLDGQRLGEAAVSEQLHWALAASVINKPTRRELSYRHGLTGRKHRIKRT